MELLLGALLILALLMGGLKLALFERVRNAVLTAVLLGAATGIGMPWAIRLNMQNVQLFIQGYETLSLVCLVQAAEALATLGLAAYLMNAHYGERTAPVLRVTALIPNAVFFGGLFVLQVIAVNRIPAQSFLLIGAGYGVAVVIVLVGLMTLGRVVLRAWLTRLNAMLSVGFFQLILAMVLPLMAQGLETPDIGWAIQLSPTFVTIGGMLTLALIGYGLRRAGIFPREVAGLAGASQQKEGEQWIS
ncbi:MAG: hypothetical protein ACLFV4_10265 [Candidatus Hydrogenedentota bacterium]